MSYVNFQTKIKSFCNKTMVVVPYDRQLIWLEFLVSFFFLNPPSLVIITSNNLRVESYFILNIKLYLKVITMTL